MREIDSTALGVSGTHWRRCRPEWLAAMVAATCYLNSLPNDFCYDDVAVVQLSPKVNEPDQWKSIWTTDYWSQASDSTPHRDLLYRPLAISSYRVVRSAFGPSPLPQRILNLLLYAGVCALIARLGRRIGFDNRQAFAAAAWFAVLPIHSEVVCSIVGRADLLAAMGVLLGILVHSRSMLGDSFGAKVGWRAVAAVAIFAAAASKESAIGGLLIVAIFDAWWARSALVPPPNDVHARSSNRLLLSGLNVLRRTSYLILPIALYLVLRSHALGGQLHQQPAPSKTVNVLVDAPMWQHALGVVQLWGMYWAKTFWPDVLAIGYAVNAIRLATDLTDGLVLIGLLVAATLLISAATSIRRKRYLAVGLVAALLISYAPTANALVLIQVFFAERIWFLSSVWISLLLVLVVGRWLKHRIVIGIGAAVLIIMAARCWIRESEWRNNVTLFAAAYRDLPESITVLQLQGQSLVHSGKLDEGIELLQRAMSMDLGFTDVYRTLGYAYMQKREWGQALHVLQIADMQVPHHPPTVTMLDKTKREWRKLHEKELQQLEAAAAESPDKVETQLNLVRKLRDFGDLEGALGILRTQAPQWRESAEWHVEHAVTCVYTNQVDAAIVYYQEAIRLEPNRIRWATELAMLFLERRKGNDMELAWQWCMKAAALAPDDPGVLVCQAEVMSAKGDINGAIERYRKVIGILPAGNPQRVYYEQRLRALGG